MVVVIGGVADEVLSETSDTIGAKVMTYIVNIAGGFN